MPVLLTVRDVRDALYQARDRSGRDSDQPAFTAQLGTWFHECLAELTSEGTGPGIRKLLADTAPQLDLWKQTLARMAFDRCVAPRLTRESAALQNASVQVLAYWQAVRAACDWLTELCWAVHESRAEGTSLRSGSAWLALTDLLTTEEPLRCELREPHWTNSVQLAGVADAILQPAMNGPWCVLEFKLGECSPEADLGQACLYHLMLSQSALSNDDRGSGPQWTRDAGSLALVRFNPQRHEQLFNMSDLQAARGPLLELIGRLAGVLPGQSPAKSAAARVAGATSTIKTAPGVTTGTPASAVADRRSSPESVAKSRPAEPLSSGSATERSAASPATAAAVAEAQEAHRRLGQNLIKALAEYGVQVVLECDPIAGPSFLRFPLSLGRGQKVKAVKNLSAELQVRLHLAAEPFVELERGQLVVDVQRLDRQMVPFESIRPHLPSEPGRLGNSRVPVGVDLQGNLHCLDFSQTEHSHVLVAGTTGSGKSEWLRTAIAGLLVSNTPETLQLLLIDPKRNAFHALRQSPFLWRPIVFPDEQPAAEVLTELADEMDRRYRLLDGADSHAELVAKSSEPVPRIVCVVDEYFDLISRSKADRKAIEEQICRLGAKARAAGIHLMIATQQPSRETLKGALDANIPARVGLKMEKVQESRMLFGCNGAERLLGHGDLLFKDIGSPKRLQAPLLSAQERETIFAGR